MISRQDFPEDASGPDSEAPPAMEALEVDADGAGMRLDQRLAAHLAPALSRSRVQALIRAGKVTVDGDAATEPKRKLFAGERIVLELPEPDMPKPRGEDIPLSILFEDADLIVIDKPAGLVVHPGPGNWSGTLVNALIHHCGDSLSGIGGVRRPGIVHRLDKETSGVMVAAKSDLAHRALSQAFAAHGRDGGMQRAYKALVWGVPNPATGTIDAPLGRAADRVRRAVVAAGRSDARHAVTHYQVDEKFGNERLASLVECRLETGRTHQIRVHMTHIGHPLIGDPEYARGYRTKANRLPEEQQAAVSVFPRQALHAALLAFDHPRTGKPLTFNSDFPADFSALLESLRTLTTSV